MLRQRALALGLLCAAGFVTACSNSVSAPGPEEEVTVGASVLGAMQDRTFDPSGRTLRVTFDRALLQGDAETRSYYRVSGATVTAAALIEPAVVRVTVDRAAVPGDYVLDVLPGIRDLDEQESEGIEDLALTSSDTVAPAGIALAAASVVGAGGDQVTVMFDDDMVAGDVQSVTRWAVQSPLGTSFSIAGATIQYDALSRSGTLTLPVGRDLATHAGLAVVVTGARDIGGNPVDVTTFGGSALTTVVTGDTTPPTIVSVAPGAVANQVQLIFSEPVQFVTTPDLIANTPVIGTRVTLTANSQLGAPQFEAFASTSTHDGLGARLTFMNVVTAGDTVAVRGIADLAGNVMFPVAAEAVIARDINPPALAQGQSTVTAMAGERNDEWVIRFDRPMHPSNLDDSFRYGLVLGFFVDTHGAEFGWNGTDEVTFRLAGETDHDVLRGVDYMLVAANLMSAQGVPITGTSFDATLVGAGDNTPPTIHSARLDPRNESSVIVTFDEAIQSTRLGAIGSYSLLFRATTAATPLGPRAARVSFDSQPNAGEVLEIVTSGRTDLAGNVAGSSAMFALLAADAAAPVITGLIAEANSGVGGDRLLLTFDDQLDLNTALELGRYTVTHAGDPMVLTGASLVYSSIAPSIELRLPEAVNLTAGAQVTVALTGVRDLAGNLASATPVAVAVTGDQAPPSSSRGFVNWRAAADGRVIDVEYDEALDEQAADLLRWSTSSGVLVQQVIRLAPNAFRVTLNAPLPSNGTLALFEPTDLAGNTGGGDLSINPIE